MARKEGSGKGLTFAIGIGVGGALLLLSRFAKGAIMEPREFGAYDKGGSPRRLTSSFSQIEFQDEYPELRLWKLTRSEFDNLSLLAKVAQRLRDKHGPMYVASGGRPRGLIVTVPAAVRAKRPELGPTAEMHTVIAAKGYNPSPTSDHDIWAAGDFIFTAAQAETYPRAAMEAARMPEVRQVIIYYVTDPATGKKVPSRLHLSVVTYGRGKIKSPNYAFITVDEKRFPGELDWQNQGGGIPNV